MREGAALGRVAFAELLRIRDQFDSTPTESSRPNLDTRAIVLERVFMRFPGQSKEALHDISLSISSGEQVAIVGPSGAGKSTIVDLICGHLEPTAGHVLIHGQPPGRFHALHPRSMAVVPQRPNTVNGSLFENVSLEPLERTDIDRAIDALRRSSLDHLTNNSSVEAPISQLGEANLSGGELQRLGLARALYATPTILLLDEATSALDAETEGAVSDFVDQLRGVTTVLIVAHRLSTVRNADRVVYVDEGKIIDVGKFDELTARVPGFARAVDLLGLGSE
jgi:ABC-type multidrug transport system fused ATPase/permease subunit